MLTAIRELAEEAEAGGDLAAIVARGDDCVVRTRELLPVLAEAGVVDAGAAGLVEIAARHRGRARRASRCPRRPWRRRRPRRRTPSTCSSREFRYCTAFVIEGDRLDADALEAELEPLGDSILVVGDPSALKVHVHTDDPGRALSLGVARGTIAARRDREHARADARARAAAAPRRARDRGGTLRARRRRVGPREPAASSRASAPTSSTAAAR